MEKYIPKAALVAEIEERINKEIQNCATDSILGYSQGCVDSMRNVLSFLDTLEVKEVDLNEEISKFIETYYSKAKLGHKLSIRRTAAYFYNLGLKALKGE